MPDRGPRQTDTPAAARTASGDDPAGRRRLIRNVLTSWGSHLVFLAAGFIMPRLIDRQVGQAALGVWDFGWSLTAYFMLALGGVISSVNRYVARYRAAGDVTSLNIFVSSITCLLLLLGTVLVGVIVLLAWALPSLLGEQLAGHLAEARWVVVLLGLSVVSQVVFAGYAGVLTGCHRWDWHNGLKAGTRALIVTGMIVALLAGGGLRELALVNLCGELLGRACRLVLAHRVCPELRVRPRLVRAAALRDALTFGGKSFLPQLGDVLMNQTISLLIVGALGPAALAAYSRPRALVHHVRIFVQKFAMVLAPTASSLQSATRIAELRELLIKSTRYAAYLSFPMLLVLTIFGGAILRVWMGPRYADEPLLATLALGHLALIVTRPALNILLGLNAHGRAGLANLAASVAAVGLAAAAIGPLKLGLLGAAWSLAIPLTLANGLVVPWLACRELGLHPLRFLSAALRGPLLCTIPFALCLAVCRVALPRQPVASLGWGLLLGGALLATLYWHHALPPSLKKTLIARLRPRRPEYAP